MDLLPILIDVLEKTTSIQCPLKTNTTFESLGMDDYVVVDFLMGVEDRFGFVFDSDDILRMKTMQDVMDMIVKKQSGGF